MKKLFYLLTLLLIFSCSHVEKNRELEEIDSNRRNKHEIIESFSFENKTKQKLQDYFDLLVLEQKHPKFREDILKQLKDISSVKKSVLDTNDIQIKKLSLIGNVEKISDSVQKFKISFDVVFGKTMRRDTIITIVSTKDIVIDGKALKATKIKFSE